MFECIGQSDFNVLRKLSEGQRAKYVTDRQLGMPALSDSGATWFSVYRIFLILNCIFGPILFLILGGFSMGVSLLLDLGSMAVDGGDEFVATGIVGFITFVTPLVMFVLSLLSIFKLDRYWQAGYTVKFIIMGILSYGFLFIIPIIFLVGIRTSVNAVPGYKEYAERVKCNKYQYKECYNQTLNAAKSYVAGIRQYLYN